jgi:hypothetical protein
MTLANHIIAAKIDQAPLNRGLDGSAWLSTPGNVPITFDNGDVVLFDNEGDGIYQVHVLLVSRGRKAIERVREAFRQMFKDHCAKLIFGMVPDFRRDVKLLARWVGCKSAGLRKTSEGPCELFVMSSMQWRRICLS